MAKIDKLGNRVREFVDVSQLTDALGKSEDFQDSFLSNWSDLLENYQATHQDVTSEIINRLPTGVYDARGQHTGDIKSQLNFARQHVQTTREEAVRYCKKNIEDILDGVEDKHKIALRVLPIRDIDLDKAYNLDKLQEIYEERAKKLKDINIVIDEHATPDIKAAQKERKRAQEMAIKENEEYASVIKDYKGLIKNIIGARELTSLLGGENKEPDYGKMQELYSASLDRDLEKFKADEDKYNDNKPLIKTLKRLAATDKNFLGQAYLEGVLNPAYTKLRESIEKDNFKDYTKRILNVMNTNKQMGIASVLYSMVEAKRQKRIDRERNDLFKDLYGFDLRSLKKAD